MAALEQALTVVKHKGADNPRDGDGAATTADALAECCGVAVRKCCGWKMDVHWGGPGGWRSFRAGSPTT